MEASGSHIPLPVRVVDWAGGGGGGGGVLGGGGGRVRMVYPTRACEEV